jgi:hypothetical protein
MAQAKPGAAADPHAGHDHGPGEHHDHDGHDHGPAQPAAGKIKWAAMPTGWTEDPTPRQMRVHTLNIEADGRKGEVIITRFGQGQVGGLLDNVNRWRGQVGLPRAEQPTEKPREMRVAGMEGFAFDFEGPTKDAEPAKRQIVAMTSQASNFWFVRFIGPKELVDAQQQSFEKLLAESRFDVPAAGAAAATQPQSSTPSSPSTQPSGSPR